MWKLVHCTREHRWKLCMFYGCMMPSFSRLHGPHLSSWRCLSHVLNIKKSELSSILTKLYGLVVVFKISVNPMWIVIISQSTTEIEKTLNRIKSMEINWLCLFRENRVWRSISWPASAYKLYTPLETIIRPIALRSSIVNEQYEVGILS